MCFFLLVHPHCWLTQIFNQTLTDKIEKNSIGGFVCAKHLTKRAHFILSLQLIDAASQCSGLINIEESERERAEKKTPITTNAYACARVSITQHTGCIDRLFASWASLSALISLFLCLSLSLFLSLSLSFSLCIINTNASVNHIQWTEERSRNKKIIFCRLPLSAERKFYWYLCRLENLFFLYRLIMYLYFVGMSVCFGWLKKFFATVCNTLYLCAVKSQHAPRFEMGFYCW